MIRLATKEDSKKIWQIRNHPKNRKFFYNQGEINFLSHNKWYLSQYFDKQKNYCFVLENESGQVIGYCRFDLRNNYYLVSIAINPGAQSHGYGSKLLNKSVSQLNIGRKILAKTIKGNVPSYKLFNKNNFIVYKEDKKAYYFKYNN